MQKTSLTFWNRFIAIWKPSFISQLMLEKNEGKSWGFWFLSNAILALLAVVGGYVFLNNWFIGFPDNVMTQLDEVVVQLPDQTQTTLDQVIVDAELEIISGDLFTKNLPDPGIIMFNESTEQVEVYDTRKNLPESDWVIVLDSAQKKFDPSVVEFFENGFFLFSKKAIIKQTEGAKAELQQFNYFDIGFSGIINHQTVSAFILELKKSVPPLLTVFVFIFLYLVLAVFRLLSVLIWSLLFWGLGSIFEIKNWSFEWSLMTVLHFKFITMILFSLLLIGGIYFFGGTLLVFLLLFAMNFWQMKQSVTQKDAIIDS